MTDKWLCVCQNPQNCIPESVNFTVYTLKKKHKKQNSGEGGGGGEENRMRTMTN